MSKLVNKSKSKPEKALKEISLEDTLKNLNDRSSVKANVDILNAEDIENQNKSEGQSVKQDLSMKETSHKDKSTI